MRSGSLQQALYHFPVPSATPLAQEPQQQRGPEDAGLGSLGEVGGLFEDLPVPLLAGFQTGEGLPATRRVGLACQGEATGQLHPQLAAGKLAGVPAGKAGGAGAQLQGPPPGLQAFPHPAAGLPPPMPPTARLPPSAPPAAGKQPGSSQDAAPRELQVLRERTLAMLQLASPATSPPPSAPATDQQPGSSQDVPHQVQVFRERALVGLGLSGWTTVFIKNVPKQLTQWGMMQELNDRGFEGQFDFVYVPADGKKRANRGIAFVNFVSPHAAYAFYRMQHGKLWEPSAPKPALITPADVQGFLENAERFSAPPVQRTAMLNRPLLLRPARQPSFSGEPAVPAPLQRLQ